LSTFYTKWPQGFPFEALEEHGKIPGEESRKIKLLVTMDIMCELAVQREVEIGT
jgi:hypothetical protein